MARLSRCPLLRGYTIIDRTWVWLIAKIDDVMQPVTSQARHVEATKREISSSGMLVVLLLASTSSFCLFSK